MKSYPISVHRETYRGSDPRKRAKVSEYNRVASRIEDHLNRDLERQPQDSVQVYTSYVIASEIGEDSALVHDIIFATDCGSNGITIYKGDYDRAMDALSGQ